MSILAIDTSNKTLSVAVVSEKETVECTLEETLQHSVKLMPTIQHVLEKSHTNIRQLSQIVIAKGPGSYTGLRIGVTVAKTLAKALNIPLMAVSSLLPLVANVAPEVPDGSYIVPFFDARREHIFTGLYRRVEGNVVLIEQECYISWEQWLAKLARIQKTMYLVGKTTPQQQASIRERLGASVKIVDERLAVPHAQTLVNFAQPSSKVDVDVFVPTYLKLAEAEENWQMSHPQKEEVMYVERL